MAKRHLYTGMHANHRRVPLPAAPPSRADALRPDFRYLINIATHYLWTVYSLMSGNYVAITTVVLVVLLSFLLPDISHKIHATNELKAMKKVIDMVSKDVSRAEVACLTVADEVCCLQCTMHDDTTETEVTIMSYLYTNSFDAQNITNINSKKSEF